MWIPFLNDNQNFLINYNGVKLSLTNLKNLWSIEVTQDYVIADFKEKNTLFCGSDEELLKAVENTITHVEAVLSFSNNEDSCTVSLKSTVDELPIKLEYVLQKQDLQTMFREITVPLIKTVQYLEMRHNKQEDLLEKKDNELKQYKFEFGEITNRKYLITKEYVKDTGELVDGLFLNIFTKSDLFQAAISEQHGDIQQSFPELKEKKKKKRKLILAGTTRKKPKTQ